MFWYIDGRFNITKMLSFIPEKHFLFSWHTKIESYKEGEYRKPSIMGTYSTFRNVSVTQKSKTVLTLG